MNSTGNGPTVGTYGVRWPGGRSDNDRVGGIMHRFNVQTGWEQIGSKNWARMTLILLRKSHQLNPKHHRE